MSLATYLEINMNAAGSEAVSVFVFRCCKCTGHTLPDSAGPAAGVLSVGFGSGSLGLIPAPAP